MPNVSPTTLSRYEGMIKRYIKPILGHIQVQQLTTLAVQAWVNSLKVSPASGKDMSAATVKHAYHVLKGAMDKAVLAGVIAKTPCTGIVLPKCRFHDLRHLCASIMLMQGVNVKVAQEHLGHKDISTTMNIYSHVLPSVAKEAAQKIGALVYEAG